MADEREQIAAAAAQLIVESGIDDWQFARRKAVKSLGLSERAPMPDRAQLESAVREYVSVYLADEQPGLVAEMREEALEWMEILAEFEPELTGPAAEGWGYPGAEIRIELLADDAKMVEIALLNRQIDVEHAPARPGGSAVVVLEAEGESGPVRLIVQDVRDRRNRRRDRLRLRAAELREQLRAMREPPREGRLPG